MCLRLVLLCDSDLWTRQTNEFKSRVCGQAIQIEIKDKTRRDEIEIGIEIEIQCND